MIRFHAENAGRRLLLVAGFCLVVTQPVNAGENPPPPSAEPQATEEPGTNDPLETINRFTSGFNAVFRGAFVDPLVDGYQAVTPKPVQKSDFQRRLQYQRTLDDRQQPASGRYRKRLDGDQKVLN